MRLNSTQCLLGRTPRRHQTSSPPPVPAEGADGWKGGVPVRGGYYTRRLLKEVRQGHDYFGLSPKGRQLRRWIVTEKDAERAGFVGDEVAELREQRLKRLGPNG